jgi:outer membrane protein insertion porin family
VHEGDAYNVYKIQRTIERLKATGYFDDVQISDTSGSAVDKKVLIVSVKEKDSTAQFKFGFNVSDANGFGGFIGFVENNLMGTGRVFSTDIFWMQKYYGCRMSIFDPHFLDKNFGAGLRIGANQCNRKRVDQSITKSVYVSPYVQYRVTDNITHMISYTITFTDNRWWNRENGKVYDKVPEDAKTLLMMKEEYGRYMSSEISSRLFYDKLDNPNRGYTLALTNSFAGIGGSVRYLKDELDGNYYYPLSKKLTFVTAASVGHIAEMRGTRSGHRYALGGDGTSMRGFDSYGIGPRDRLGNSLGGNKYWTLSFMVKAPLSTKEMGINGVVFVDFGSAWGSKYDKAKISDSSGIRSSAGVAIEWARSSLGVPMSFVFGFVLKKKKFDESQTFTLTGLM